MQDYKRNLHNIPLFAGIKESDLDPMFKCIGSYVRSYKKGEYISLAEEEVTCVGVVISGTVHMLKEDLSGNKTILTFIKEDQIFGETFACISAYPATVSFFAASHVDVFFLPFDRVIHSCTISCEFHHKLIKNMVTLIAKKNIQLMERLEITSKRTLREKILAFLSLQAEKQKGKYIVLSMGRLEMADYLCVNRSALTRELSNMRTDGLIDYDKNTFQLL